MRPSRWVSMTLGAVVVMTFLHVASTGGEEDYAPSQARESWVGGAWDDLSADQRETLVREILALPREHFLERSAMAYVESQGYRLTEIMGPVVLAADEGPKLLAFREGVTYVLSLPVVDAPLFPGLYWTSGIGSSWSVLLPDGERATYWVARQL